MIRLKYWIPNLLSFKTICDMPQQTYWKWLWFWLKFDITVLPCTLHNLASFNHFSLISTPNCNLLDPLDSWLPKLQIHIWIASRNFYNVVPILSSIQHHCVAMDLKPRTSKIASFFFNHHRITKRTFKIPSTIEGCKKLKFLHQ